MQLRQGDHIIKASSMNTAEASELQRLQKQYAEIQLNIQTSTQALVEQINKLSEKVDGGGPPLMTVP